MSDRKLTAFVFSLKNVRFFSFFIVNTKGRHALALSICFCEHLKHIL
ncbi:hypothetical protein [Moraxella lacunata]